MRIRDYKRLLDVQEFKRSNEYIRDNYPTLVKKAKSSTDIFINEFYFIAISSTDDYADKLAKEHYKEYFIIDDNVASDNEFSSSLTDLQIIDLEKYLLRDDIGFQFRKVVIFYLIIYNQYYRFSNKFQDEFNEIKADLIRNIKMFNNERQQESIDKVRDITRVPQKFLVWYLHIPVSQVKILIKRYKDLITFILEG